MANVITPTNVGNTIRYGLIVANKFDVNTDPQTIEVSPMGVLSVKESVLVTPVSITLGLNDRDILVENGSTNVVITVPAGIGRIRISRSLNSSGQVRIAFAGGQVEDLVGNQVALDALAGLGSYGDGATFIEFPTILRRLRT